MYLHSLRAGSNTAMLRVSVKITSHILIHYHVRYSLSPAMILRQRELSPMLMESGLLRRHTGLRLQLVHGADLYHLLFRQDRNML